LNILNCDSYNYIVDSRSGVFHSKESLCLYKIPVDAIQGVVKYPDKEGYTPCQECIKEEDKSLTEKNNCNSNVYEVEKRLIDGHYASNNKIIARCHNLIHRGYLTKRLTKSHKCIEKKCTFFQKLRPEYWEALERSEIAKENERLKMKGIKKTLKDREAMIRELFEDCGCVYKTSIVENDDLVGISYIYDKRVDLLPEIRFLRNKLGKTVKLKAMRGTDEAIEKLIKKPRRETQQVTDLCKAPKVGKAIKERFALLGIFCLEDLFGRNGVQLYRLDCKLSGKQVNRKYLNAYRSAVDFANNMEVEKLRE